jgi:hypothetical protein
MAANVAIRPHFFTLFILQTQSFKRTGTILPLDGLDVIVKPCLAF